MLRLLVVLVLGMCLLLEPPLLGSDSPKKYDDRTEVDELQGTSWQAVAWESAGERQADKGQLIHTFRDGQWRISLVAEPIGAYTTDTSHYPARLNRIEFLDDGKVQTWKCIYHIDGDTLRIAYKEDGGNRPKSFDDNAGLHIEFYKRWKK